VARGRGRDRIPVPSTRRIQGNDFLPLIALGQPAIRIDEVDHELSQIRCRVHARQFLPAVGRVGAGGVRAFSYFTKDLRLTIDLLVTRSKYGGDRLVIRAPETEYSGIGGEPTPPLLVHTELTALLLLWPSAFAPEYYTRRPERLEFQLVAGPIEPEPLVTFLPSQRARFDRVT
jgi:hypothetical protein